MLDGAVFNAKHLLDRYFAGCMVFALYARARWSDMSNINTLDFDFVTKDGRRFGFVEARNSTHQWS